jgi:hypothetical protein
LKKMMGALALLLTFAATSAFACTRVEGPPASVKDLSIGAAAFNVGGDGENMLTTLGTIKNRSVNCMDSIVVEVKYFDAKNELIDTITQPVYGIVVPGEGEVAFRVSDAASRPKEAYATQTIRVVSAEPKGARARAPKSTMDTIGEYLLSWAPMLLLIGVWIFFMFRMKSKDSPQTRTINLIEEQNAMFESQNKLLARIAVALEGKSG